MRVFVQDQGMRKNTTGICLIFRGLFFEHNADIGQKDHLWMDTKLFLSEPLRNFQKNNLRILLALLPVFCVVTTGT